MLTENLCFKTRVSFYDTDAMGVMHHAAFLRKFEDARVYWLRERQLSQYHHPYMDMVLAVKKVSINFKKPCKFDQELSVYLQARRRQLKLDIEYALFDNTKNLLATGSTQHVPMNEKLAITRYAPEFIQALENEKWTETWPSNLLE